MSGAVVLRRWSDEDLSLLRRANTPEMTVHLGGPEPDEAVLARHERYLRYWDEGTARMFAVVDRGRSRGAMGHWGTTWRGSAVREAGWFVVPEGQGTGTATTALAVLIDDAVGHRGAADLLVAFPAVANTASNALCRRAGLTPRGLEVHSFRSREFDVRVWALDLRPDRRRQP